MGKTIHREDTKKVETIMVIDESTLSHPD